MATVLEGARGTLKYGAAVGVIPSHSIDVMSFTT